LYLADALTLILFSLLAEAGMRLVP
jgi:hypothetical protein